MLPQWYSVKLENMEPIIKVENLGKSYIIGHQRESYVALRDVLANKARQVVSKTKNLLSGGQLIAGNELEEFWALKDINFEVQQGDRVGIIGRNGAGKSTLLKVLSRITEPTTGSIRLRGRVASLLEVGTGFHPELSGRENIYLNGAILGMSRAEVKKKFDEIVDFAGVEKFLDTPVKRYSSGMYVRLAFAVAAHLEPEILIVDEVLAVGDAEFQKKCLGKMEDVSKNHGRTVLFVSHNMGAISNLCNCAFLLERGNIISPGNINETIAYYEKKTKYDSHWIGEDGDNNVKIKETQILDTTKNEPIKNSSKIGIKIIFETFFDFSDLYIGFTLCSSYGDALACVIYNDYNNSSFIKKGTYEVFFTIPSYTLAVGEYTINFNISIPFVKLINSEAINLSFRVVAENIIGNRYFIENSKNFNSIMRPNWFDKLEKIK